MDRISELPDFIVHRILSFIKTSPPAELVRMSVLSKTWFHLTASFPVLDFSIYRFRSRESFFKYLEYTTSRFCHHKLTAHRLTLDATIQEPAELDVVNRCLEMLLKIGVRELVIGVTNSSNASAKYRLPDILLLVSVLKFLAISDCDCDLPSSLMLDAVKFKSLIRLQLENVHIDDEAIKYLTTSCPLLQEFKVIACHGFKSFCVHGHHNLQSVVIFETPVERIDIEAPNLSYLSLSVEEGRGQPQMNLPSCKKLTSVSYGGYSSGFPDFLSNFPFVEGVVLDTTSTCNNIKLSSHSLRKLLLLSKCDLEGIEFSTPNLGLFSCSHNIWYRCRELRHLLPYLKACMLCCYPYGYIDALWFQKLRLFFDKKNGFKALNLYIHTIQKFMV